MWLLFREAILLNSSYYSFVRNWAQYELIKFQLEQNRFLMEVVSIEFFMVKTAAFKVRMEISKVKILNDLTDVHRCD